MRHFMRDLITSPMSNQKKSKKRVFCDIDIEKGRAWLSAINDSVGIKKVSYEQVY